MGKEIVRQECPKEPGKRSRLCDPNDVQSVLIEKTVRVKYILFKKLYISAMIKFSFVHIVFSLFLKFSFSGD